MTGVCTCPIARPVASTPTRRLACSARAVRRLRARTVASFLAPITVTHGARSRSSRAVLLRPCLVSLWISIASAGEQQ